MVKILKTVQKVAPGASTPYLTTEEIDVPNHPFQAKDLNPSVCTVCDQPLMHEVHHAAQDPEAPVALQTESQAKELEYNRQRAEASQGHKRVDDLHAEEDSSLAKHGRAKRK